MTDIPSEAEIRAAYARTTPVSPAAIKAARDRAEAEIRADERGRVEREIGDWLDRTRREMEPQDECYTMEWIRSAIQRGEYRKTEETP